MSSHAAAGFAALLRQILVEEQNQTLKDVARAMGMDARNFYGRVNGRINFTPEEVNQVLRVVPDPRLAECLFAHTRLTSSPRIDPAPREPGVTNVDYASHAVEETVAALRSVIRMAGGTPPSDAEREEVAQRVLAAQQQLAALQMSLMSTGRWCVAGTSDVRTEGRPAMSTAASARQRRPAALRLPQGTTHATAIEAVAAEQAQ